MQLKNEMVIAYCCRLKAGECAGRGFYHEYKYSSLWARVWKLALAMLEAAGGNYSLSCLRLTRQAYVFYHRYKYSSLWARFWKLALAMLKPIGGWRIAKSPIMVLQLPCEDSRREAINRCWIFVWKSIRHPEVSGRTAVHETLRMVVKFIKSNADKAF